MRTFLIKRQASPYCRGTRNHNRAAIASRRYKYRNAASHLGALLYKSIWQMVVDIALYRSVM